MARKTYEKTVTATMNTGGDGFWSRAKRPVRLHKLVLVEFHEGKVHYGELRVQFILEDWDRDQHGLIYTDRQFMYEFKRWIAKAFDLSPAATAEINYSEQGMQGRDFISMDVGAEFLHEYIAEINKK